MLQQEELERLRAENAKFREALEAISASDPADFDEPADEWGYAAVGHFSQKQANKALGYKD